MTPCPAAWPLAQAAVAGCALWTVDLDAEPAGAAAAVLSGEELQRAARFVFERDRARFIAGRAALRRLLGATLGREPQRLQLQAEPGGKPVLAGAEAAVAFNLSHSGAQALIAIDATGRAGRRIGVDLEVVRPVPDRLALARTCFDAGEIAELQALPEAMQDRAFLTGWTRKEACLKASGEGFSAGCIPSTGIDAGTRLVGLHGDAPARVTSVALAGAIAAVAVIESGPAGDPTP